MSTSRLASAAAAVTLAVIAGGCGSTSTTSVLPSPVKCEFKVAPGTASVGSGGGSGTVVVTAQPECAWSALADVTWISSVTPASGQGNGQVQFQAAANTGAVRTGTFSVADQKVSVTQASGCTFTVAPTSVSAGAGGGNSSVSVTSGSGCTWTAVSQASWLTVTAGAAGTGSGPVAFAIAANTGGQRSGTLLVATRTVTVTQASGCTYSINPTTRNFGVAGGSVSVGVTTNPGCTWTAASNDSWLTVTAGASGTGNATVQIVAAPSVIRRTGTVTIAGQTFTATQP